jgi:hypothetical protein
MPTGTHEQTINTALGEVLHHLGRAWTLRSENVGRIFEEGGRPDILLEKSDGWPIVIEAEVGNHAQAENEAKSRLGNRLITTGNPIHASVALVYPDYLRAHHGAALRSELQQAQFEYALFTVQADGATARFPPRGMVKKWDRRVSDTATPVQHPGLACRSVGRRSGTGCQSSRSGILSVASYNKPAWHLNRPTPRTERRLCGTDSAYGNDGSCRRVGLPCCAS